VISEPGIACGVRFDKRCQVQVCPPVFVLVLAFRLIGASTLGSIEAFTGRQSFLSPRERG
jgi:hypothetical protein